MFAETPNAQTISKTMKKATSEQDRIVRNRLGNMKKLKVRTTGKRKLKELSLLGYFQQTRNTPCGLSIRQQIWDAVGSEFLRDVPALTVFKAIRKLANSKHSRFLLQTTWSDLLSTKIGLCHFGREFEAFVVEKLTNQQGPVSRLVQSAANASIGTAKATLDTVRQDSVRSKNENFEINTRSMALFFRYFISRGFRESFTSTFCADACMEIKPIGSNTTFVYKLDKAYDKSSASQMSLVHFDEVLLETAPSPSFPEFRGPLPAVIQIPCFYDYELQISLAVMKDILVAIGLEESAQIIIMCFIGPRTLLDTSTGTWKPHRARPNINAVRIKDKVRRKQFYEEREHIRSQMIAHMKKCVPLVS